MPLRRQITTLDRAALREEALATFGLDPRRRVLLVFGGSLGAQRLNVTFGQSRDILASAGVQVLHVTGRGKTVEGLDTTPAASGSPAYVVVEYLDRMDLAYAAADLVVCRAGAGTVCEVTTVGLPAAYVPLPIGNGEQRLNAAARRRGRRRPARRRRALHAGLGAGATAATARRRRPTRRPWRRRRASSASRDGDERLADLVGLAVAEAGAGRARVRRASS